jgi:hypothetical protein
MNDYRYDQRNSQHTGWDSNDGWGAMQRTAAEVGVAERMGFIRKVYALFFTGVLCVVGANLFAIFIAGKALLLPIAQHPIITFLVLIGATFGVSAVRKTPVVNLIAYYAIHRPAGRRRRAADGVRAVEKSGFDSASRIFDDRDFRRTDRLRVHLEKRLQLHARLFGDGIDDCARGRGREFVFRGGRRQLRRFRFVARAVFGLRAL